MLSWVDWLVLIGTLSFIVIYGIYKTRKETLQDYLRNDNKLKWWQIGISVMATQASAVTFISTPGQGFADGMGFIQFYFGMPIAITILVIFIIPVYHKLKIYTAYQYLESRFDVRVRQLTAFLFLVQRSLSAGITIYAPAIILSIVFEWSLSVTTLFIGALVIGYTVSGGAKAVNITQRQQMAVMMIGMIVALIFIIYKTSDYASLSDSIGILKDAGKLNMINTSFNFKNKYTLWSGLIGGSFLALSYFGTDQSQVGRYIGGRSLKEIKMGLVFNAIFKIPMQMLILFTGAMLFVFYLYVKPPVIFNTVELDKLKTSEYAGELNELEKQYLLSNANYLSVISSTANTPETKAMLKEYKTEQKEIKSKVETLVKKNNPAALADDDNDFTFIHFILNYMPHGMVGLLFAVILCAAMSSTSSELNALGTTAVVDFYQRSFAKDKTPDHYVKASRWITAFWGCLAIFFAMIFSLFENLIEAVNIIGSLFYGVILGIFVTGFFIKRIQSTALLIAAVISEIIVVVTYILEIQDRIDFAYLWLNPLGCLGVVIFASILQPLFPRRTVSN